MAKAIVHYESFKNYYFFPFFFLQQPVAQLDKKIIFFLNTVHGISPRLH